MNHSTIGVYLSEEELLIIAGWINHLRDVSLDREWTEQEEVLSKKFHDSGVFLYDINH